MKKIIPLFITIIMIFTLFVVPANAVGGSLAGSTSTPRPGEKFTVTFRVDGQVTGFQGTLSYDSSVVTLQSVNSRCGGGWSFSQSGGSIVAYDTAATSPQTGGLFDAVFVVNSGVSTGTGVSIGFSGKVTPADGSGSSGVGSTYSASVAAPLSDDATLSALSVSNATMSPSFSAGTTSYSCGKVKFDVSKLNVSATANAQGASVSISGANLRVGKNNVNVVVTAPNGATKTYTISVEREQDPNYVASKDTALASVEISEGKLSPEFSAKQTEYVIYLPYEIEKISINGAAADELAQGVEGFTDKELEVGLNELVLKVTAEDGTVGNYTFYVVRMDKFGGKDTVGLPASLLDLPEEVEEEVKEEEQGFQFTPIMVAGVGVACLLLGFGIGALVFRKKKHKGPDDMDPPSDDLNISEYTDYEDISSVSIDNVDGLVDEYLNDEKPL